MQTPTTPKRRSPRSPVAALAVLLVAAVVVPAAILVRGGGASEGKTRTYYIAADPVDWDYAPAGHNLLGEHFEADTATFLENGPDRIGHVDKKSMYREYTDDSFSKLLGRTERWEHLGLLGPVIHAEVGDTVKVVLKNNTPFPASMHPHGFRYDKASEGADYEDGTSGKDKADDAVPPGGRHTYLWEVPERAGPGPHDESSVVWAYHSHTDEIAETNAGLIGPIVVTRRGEARPDGSPKDVDREFVTLFNIYDENLSPWLDENIKQFAGDPAKVDKEDPGFVESNLKHSINGFLYGNLPGLDMKAGEKVRWYALAAGTETGLHTPHWHGNTVLSMGMRMDNIELLPMSMKVADMVPDAKGSWLYHCHVNDHIAGGMAALFTVK